MSAEFTINGVRVEYHGEYGEEGERRDDSRWCNGGIYFYDDARNVEIVMWDAQEWIAEPSLMSVIVEAFDYAHAHGVEGVAGRFKPDYLEVNHDEVDPDVQEAPEDVKVCMPDPTVKLCAACIDAYRNGIEPGETACEDRARDERA
jgi:hypothetical protein